MPWKVCLAGSKQMMPDLVFIYYINGYRAHFVFPSLPTFAGDLCAGAALELFPREKK